MARNLESILRSMNSTARVAAQDPVLAAALVQLYKQFPDGRRETSHPRKRRPGYRAACPH